MEGRGIKRNRIYRRDIRRPERAKGCAPPRTRAEGVWTHLPIRFYRVAPGWCRGDVVMNASQRVGHETDDKAHDHAPVENVGRMRLYILPPPALTNPRHRRGALHARSSAGTGIRSASKTVDRKICTISIACTWRVKLNPWYRGGKVSKEVH